MVTCDGLQTIIDDTYKEIWFLVKEEAEAALKELRRSGRKTGEIKNIQTKNN